MKVIRSVVENLVLLEIGGGLYLLIELLFRGYSHWTMFFVGGLCFLLVGWINEFIPWKVALWKQMLLGGFLITLVEFLSGCLLNLFLGLNIWDYSDLPLNLLGQICLPFSLIWVGLSLVAIVLDDLIRWLVFKEEKPHYKLF